METMIGMERVAAADRVKKRIMLVDDDRVMLATLEEGLLEGFDIVAKCETGEDALKLLSALPSDLHPQLVVLDIRMPGTGGIACCRELRRLFPVVLVAMHTAKSARACFEQARNAGADAYIEKGTPMEELAEELRGLERRKRKCVCVAPLGLGNSNRPPHGLDLLTPCESIVLERLSKGQVQKEIAAVMGCSERNVRKLLSRAKARFGAGTTGQLIRLWLAKQEGS